MSDCRKPEVTGAPSADARSAEAVAEAVAGARGPANFTVDHCDTTCNLHDQL